NEINKLNGEELIVSCNEWIKEAGGENHVRGIVVYLNAVNSETLKLLILRLLALTCRVIKLALELSNTKPDSDNSQLENNLKPIKLMAFRMLYIVQNLIFIPARLRGEKPFKELQNKLSQHELYGGKYGSYTHWKLMLFPEELKKGHFNRPQFSTVDENKKVDIFNIIISNFHKEIENCLNFIGYKVFNENLAKSMYE
ncbi:MAG: hypothetical protein LBU04_01935, partial [Christensenellaceae bacterium]|nr:hypothetical protein [Christensenellaceae bacterium]